MGASTTIQPDRNGWLHERIKCRGMRMLYAPGWRGPTLAPDGIAEPHMVRAMRSKRGDLRAQPDVGIRNGTSHSCQLRGQPIGTFNQA